MNEQTMMAMYHLLIHLVPHYAIINHQLYESLTFWTSR